MDREVERLHELQADPQVRIESFEADIEVRAEDLAGLTTVRFVIRGLSGSLRLKFPKLDYKNEPKTIEEQARVFYRLVDVAGQPAHRRGDARLDLLQRVVDIAFERQQHAQRRFRRCR